MSGQQPSMSGSRSQVSRYLMPIADIRRHVVERIIEEIRTHFSNRRISITEYCVKVITFLEDYLQDNFEKFIADGSLPDHGRYELMKRIMEFREGNAQVWKAALSAFEASSPQDRYRHDIGNAFELSFTPKENLMTKLEMSERLHDLVQYLSTQNSYFRRS